MCNQLICKFHVFFLFMILFAINITGCSNSSSLPQSPPSEKSAALARHLSGTVAAGAPIEGTITIVDMDGNTSTTDSGADGKYSADLGRSMGPYLLRFEPNDNTLPIMYSYAVDAGVANITPFTTLALFLTNQTDLDSAFNDWTAMHTNWKWKDGLEKAIATINANFDPQLLNSEVSNATTYDLFTAPFNADHTLIDQYLYDSYNVSVDFTNQTYAITDNAGQPFPFDPNKDISNYNIDAQFTPPANASWTYSAKTNLDGTVDNIVLPDFYTSDVIPWNEQRAKEIFWTNLAIQTPKIDYCAKTTDPCSIDVQVTGLSTTYNVAGNGEVGTLITAAASYSVHLTGYVGSGASLKNIDESHSWSYSWSWERTN